MLKVANENGKKVLDHLSMNMATSRPWQKVTYLERSGGVDGLSGVLATLLRYRRRLLFVGDICFMDI